MDDDPSIANNDIIVRIATPADTRFAEQISKETEASAKVRGCGISKRSAEVIIQKILAGKAIVAVTKNNEWAGFAYIDIWSNGEFVSNSGLIVNPAYRKKGIATAIKKKLFALCRKHYPYAKIFSITTGFAIMEMNTRLGFVPVTFAELTNDKAYWKGCQSCVNYDILQSKNCKNCLCTAMLYDPAKCCAKKNESLNALTAG